MPNRIIKETICTSSGLSEVTIFTQDLYKRLITYADDYGRFNCDPIIILARLYPREMDWLTKEDIWEAMEELCLVGKIQFYSVNDRRFVYDLLGYFPNWHDHQRIRESKSNLPAPNEFDKTLNDWALRRLISLQLKIDVVSRDKCICQSCKKNLNPNNINIKRLIKLKDGSLHFDHVIPVRNGGRATKENLQLLCPKCNLSKPRNYTYSDIINYLRGEPPQVAASCGELPPNPIQSNPNPIQSESNTNTPARKNSKSGKVQLVKQSADTEKVQFADNVTMTNAEHEKLISTYGEANTARMIEKLDNYKGSTGKKYNNDYRTILNWVADEITKQKNKEGVENNGSTEFRLGLYL